MYFLVVVCQCEACTARLVGIGWSQVLVQSRGPECEPAVTTWVPALLQVVSMPSRRDLTMQTRLALAHRALSASVSYVLELKACSTMPGKCIYFNFGMGTEQELFKL